MPRQEVRWISFVAMVLNIALMCRPQTNLNDDKLAWPQRRDTHHNNQSALINIRLRHGAAITFDEIGLLGLSA